uniref:Uncharacterized protein n=1 Tax=Arundo donax TaxID=35708 RepID=A0A0A9GQY9_ARUDO
MQALAALLMAPLFLAEKVLSLALLVAFQALVTPSRTLNLKRKLCSKILANLILTPDSVMKLWSKEKGVQYKWTNVSSAMLLFLMTVLVFLF